VTYTDLHSALKTVVVAELSEAGIEYKHVRLQHGKDNFVDSLHARPSSFSTAGIQATDFLYVLGFRRAKCAFHVGGECYCRRLPHAVDLEGLVKAIARALEKFTRASQGLERCGLNIDQPEGWGFFYGKPSAERTYHASRPSGDGHVAPKTQRLKESEDNFFRYVFTWIEGGTDKGWTTHYRAKHMPLSPEFQASLDFLGGFSSFAECPEFDFEGCWWRFMPFRADEDNLLNRNTEYAHRCFDSHANNCSQGLELLLAAHAELQVYGLSFLSLQASSPATQRPAKSAEPPHAQQRSSSSRSYRYDVAISYAGTERHHVEELARLVRDAGFEVFYDGFYAEQLWGKDLASFFDQIYRKDARFCVMFVSQEYADRMWTNHERRSAQARAVQEKGREYILPVRVDHTDLVGLPPTVGYVSLEQYSIGSIANLLIKKLRSTS
jgi:hypothetical protein